MLTSQLQDPEQYPANVQDYLDNSPFKVVYLIRMRGAVTKGYSFMMHPDKKKSF